MKERKQEVRNIPLHYIEVNKDDTASSYQGEFRAQLDFVMPWNSKSKRLFRMRVSPCQIAYLRERLNEAEKIIRTRFEDSFK